MLTIAALFFAVPLPPGAAAIPLPKDPKAVVVEFSFKGGFTPPRKNNDPNLTVTAGGAVTASDPFTGATATFQLPAEELQGLMHLIVAQKKFFDISEEKIAKAIQEQKAGIGIAIADAATTVVKIKTADKEHEVKVYALGMQANQYKKVEALLNLVAIEKTLNQLLSTAWAGGPVAVEASLKVANAELKKTFPDLKPLAADDLRFARMNPQGNVTLNFHRSSDPAKNSLDVALQKADDSYKITSLARSLTPEEYAAHTKDNKAFAKLLDAVNAEVKKKFPAFANLTPADLQSLQWRDGQVHAFLRKTGDVQTSFVTVNVSVPANGAAMITVNGRVK